MYFSHIFDEINNREYEETELVMDHKVKDNHIFDENKSIVWNREQVISFNQELDRINKKQRELLQIANNRFTNDVISAIMDICNINKIKAGKVYSYAWKLSHSGGRHEIVDTAHDLAFLISEII